MKTKSSTARRRAYVLTSAMASAAVITLVGCGGSGGSGPLNIDVTQAQTVPTTPPVVVAAMVDVPVLVIDGPIRNATVCLDKNGNGVCDTGEPVGKTDAAGSVTLKVAPEDVGKFAVLAVVGTDAVDADTGPVAVAYTMTAPADKPALVSPLTTLVHTLATSSAITTAQAEANIKEQIGVASSLFEDFTKGTSADSKLAATVARMVVVTSQQQSVAAASAVGTAAIDGSTISAADVDRAVRSKMIEIMPSVMTKLGDNSVTVAATPAAKEAAFLAQAKTLVLDTSTGMTTGTVATAVAINKQISAITAAVNDASAPSATLRSLSFADAKNWLVRIFTASTAQNTLDASARNRSVPRRTNSADGVLTNWNLGNNPNRQSDVFFNGKNWVACGVNQEETSTPRDAKGNALYTSCDNLETGTFNRASFDIAGRSMQDVFKQIATGGYTNLAVTSPETTLGAAAFPANSRLIYQTSTVLSTAATYLPGSSSWITQYSKEVSAGGVASTQPAGTGCNAAEFNGNGSLTTTLEGLIAAATGTPCDFTGTRAPSFVYNGITYTSPELRNEAWGNSILNISTVGGLPVGTGATAPGYYSGNTGLRVAFRGAGPNAVTYLACKVRFNNGSTRNCEPIGTGTYTISTQGDARVLSLNNPPPIVVGIGFQRIFVERGGKVYSGFKNNTGTFASARMNLAASNALFTQLGVPTVDPETPLALTPTSYFGTWDGQSSNATAFTYTINYNGTSTCTVAGTARACTLSVTNPATGAFSLNLGTAGTYSGNLGFLTGDASGNYTDASATPTSGTFTAVRR